MKKNLRSLILGTGFALASCFAGGSAYSQTVYNDYIDGQIWFQIKADQIVQRTVSRAGVENTDLNNLRLNTLPYLR